MTSTEEMLRAALDRIEALENQTQDKAPGKVHGDREWACAKCRARLGFYDPKADVMRIRYRDHITYVKIGVGGFLQVICRTCGEANVLDYVAETPEAPRNQSLITDLKAALTAG